MYRPSLRSEWIIVAVTGYLVLTANHAFFARIARIAADSGVAFWPQALAFGALLAGLLGMLLALVTPSRLARWQLGAVVLLCSVLAYFMDGYGAVIDRHALQSVLETDAREGAEWLSAGMLRSIAMVALPGLAFLAWVRVAPRAWRPAILSRLSLLAAGVVLVVASLALNYQAMASIARNHPELRDLANPLNLVNAVRSYRRHAGEEYAGPVTPVATDVHRGTTWGKAGRPVVLVLVVGESARASSFGLLGYQRDTTPELSRREVLAFGNVRACGTNTATSVPCLFSGMGEAAYDQSRARRRENLLDVLQRAGFAVTWIDNNTGSKHVADRVEEVDVAAATEPLVCSALGCYDQILVDELQRRLATIARDTVLVLHQKGSHGPAYFERYPESFRRFQPDCRSNELQSCSRAQLVNSYDNTILYTDHILAAMIDALAVAGDRVDGLLFYVSDHGESTGEHGYYLHGAPRVIAPEEQTRVPMLLWTSPGYRERRRLESACIAARRDTKTSHDAVFPLVLGLLDLHTTAYDPKLDPIAACAPRP